MLPNDEPWDRAGLAVLRARQRTERHAGPEMARPPERLAGQMSPIDARAAEWAVRRAADELAKGAPALREYIDRCVAHRGPELGVAFIRGSEFDPFKQDLLLAALEEARGDLASPRYSRPPEIEAELIAWCRALWFADELAAMAEAEAWGSTGSAP